MKLLIFNGKYLIFEGKYLIFNGNYFILDGKYLVFDGKYLIGLNLQWVGRGGRFVIYKPLTELVGSCDGWVAAGAS